MTEHRITVERGRIGAVAAQVNRLIAQYQENIVLEWNRPGGGHDDVGLFTKLGKLARFHQCLDELGDLEHKLDLQARREKRRQANDLAAVPAEADDFPSQNDRSRS